MKNIVWTGLLQNTKTCKNPVPDFAEQYELVNADGSVVGTFSHEEPCAKRWWNSVHTMHSMAKYYRYSVPQAMWWLARNLPGHYLNEGCIDRIGLCSDGEVECYDWKGYDFSGRLDYYPQGIVSGPPTGAGPFTVSDLKLLRKHLNNSGTTAFESESSASKVKTAYKTSDGKYHDSLDEAEKHQRFVDACEQHGLYKTCTFKDLDELKNFIKQYGHLVQ